MKATLQTIQTRTEDKLIDALDQAQIADAHLLEVMRYGLLNGGKRLRPFLVYATCQALGADFSVADPSACAIEMVHSYSLVHDDLPAMDDDDLRRGKPTCHVQFDEASAILAGDALLTEAFAHLARAPLPAPQIVTLIQLLARASGPAGMVAGQHTDLRHVGQAMTLDALETMHRHKTGALIEAAVLMGAYSANADLPAKDVSALSAYAQAIGLAFQVHDDVLDIESDAATLGKPQGADLALDKPTYPALMGLNEAKAKASALITDAKNALSHLAYDTVLLEQLADYVIERRY